jgi:diguanylate cyclase (GGDEF)-like protein/PAS domain S-box-containing protein
MTARAQRAKWWLVALAAFAATLAVRTSGILVQAEWTASDLYAHWLRHEVNSDIVIIGIDAESLEDLKQWPWPRSTHARLLDRLQRSTLKRLFFDVDFSSTSDPIQDEALARSIARWQPGRLVLPAFLQVASGGTDDVLLTHPLPQFARFATLGSVNLRPDKDALVREISTGWQGPGPKLRPVFSLLANQAHDPSSVTIDYAISPASFEYVSYTDVLNDRVPLADFAGKTVLIGATATQLGDLQPVPVYQSLPGVVVEALAAQTLRNGTIHGLTQFQSMALLALWSLLVAAALTRGTWQLNIGLVVAGIGAVIAGTLWARSHLLVLEVLSPMVTIGAGFLTVTFRSLNIETLRALRFAKLADERDALLQSIVQSSNECIMCVNQEGRVLSANATAQRLFAARDNQLINSTLDDLVPGLLCRTGTNRLAQAIGKIAEYMALSFDGSQVPIELSVSPADPAKRELFTVIVRDLRERNAKDDELRHQATHDSLTGIPNRHWLGLQLAQAMQVRDAHEPLSLLIMDLTRFKEVNDTLGHSVGDLVLKEVTQRFQRVVGTRGLLARMGGDEFAVVCDKEFDSHELATLAVQLSEALESPIKADSMAIEVGVNIGIACYPADAQDAETLLKNADVAMYSAKRSGENHAFYNARLNQHSVRRLEMLSEFRTAIKTAALELWYQPQVNLQTGSAESVEALLRWQNPKYGHVSPTEFIPLAESTDLLRPLTEWTIVQALLQSRIWHEQGVDVRVAVNLSARLLQDASLPTRLAQLLAEHSVRPDSLELEITETAMMFDVTRALSVVKAIHDLGVLVSIDDYGTGFSSLAYLRDLNVHALKLDRSFVSNLETIAGNRIIVESTVALAHALKLQVIAEGVESQWQARFLAAAGFDSGQGYFYSKALPAMQCGEWLKVRNRQCLEEPPHLLVAAQSSG